MTDTPIKPYIMPGECIVFSGLDAIFCPEKEIAFDQIAHESFEINAVEESLKYIDEKIMEIVTGFPFSKFRLQDLAIIVSEAVNNAITNGPQSTDRKIWVDILYLPRIMLYVFVRDDLGQLKIEDINMGIPDTFATDESGRGYLIMATLSTILAYIPGYGNRLKEIAIGLEPDLKEES